jgi:small-conductance mechanosensitive channel
VQVAYGTDVDRALKLLESIALADPRVLREARAPAAALLALGDNGITLELGVWVGDPHIQGNLRSTLYRAVLKQFADNGIAIPSPQRDVRVIGPLADRSAGLADPGTATPARGNPA